MSRRCLTRPSLRAVVPALLAVLLLVAGCSGDAGGEAPASLEESVALPEVGSCRVLGPDDVTQSSNASPTVDCAEEHTAQTYAVDELPEKFADVARDDRALGKFAYRTCSRKFMRFLGADESVVMRTVLSWAWFRPTEEAWAAGARWYRCDLVGGAEQSEVYVPLPAEAKHMLRGLPGDEWMACVAGPSVAGAPRIPCSEPHDWKAATTIKVGQPDDAYPGDRKVEVTSRDFCSRSVGAWLGYPDDYEFAYTWFRRAEWQVGNRRSVCWAKVDK